jgi:hypothetical protein
MTDYNINLFVRIGFLSFRKFCFVVCILCKQICPAPINVSCVLLNTYPIVILRKIYCMPWRRGIVVIAFAYRTQDSGFKSRQAVKFLGLYTLQCCCQNLIFVMHYNCVYLRKINAMLHIKKRCTYVALICMWVTVFNMLFAYADRSWPITKLFSVQNQGCQIFLIPKIPKRENIPNDHKLYQMAIKYRKWPQTTPNGHKICQHFPFKGPPKSTQIGIFGLKLNHLATLVSEPTEKFSPS